MDLNAFIAICGWSIALMANIQKSKPVTKPFPAINPSCGPYFFLRSAN